MNVLVTGASSGIGRALVLEFCKEGASVVGLSRNEGALRELAEICKNFDFLLSDLSDLSSLSSIRERLMVLGHLDVLINNAGFGAYRRMLETEPDDIVKMASVNFLAPILLTKELLPLMREGSTVVNIITAGVHVLLSGLPLYGATKIALHYVSEAMRDELKERGIRLISVYPGLVNTDFHSRAGKEVRGGIAPEVVARIVIRAIKEGRERVYVPRYLGLLRLLGPHLPRVRQ
ncbi:MAG: SDR family oxidoreductase [Candidatus Korarchaeum sp.]